MEKYVKKPVVIEAVQLIDTECSIIECSEFIEGIKLKDCFKKHKKECSDFIFETRRFGGLIINTLEGDMRASFGDYIIEGVNGEHYACKPDIFEKTYEKVKK